MRVVGDDVMHVCVYMYVCMYVHVYIYMCRCVLCGSALLSCYVAVRYIFVRL
jgi:hypothetical protein